MDVILVSVILAFYCVNVVVCYIDESLIDEYCKVKCPKHYGKEVKHTVCEFRCEISADCKDFKNFEMTPKQRQYVLDLHNHYRNLVASGQDTRGGNGKAKDMIAMNYDVDIEIPATCWGRRCVYDHDRCRQSLKYSTAGQNLYIANYYVSMDEPQQKHHLNNSAFHWYEEISLTNKSDIIKFGSGDNIAQIGHFTQMLWATTEVIGCAKVSYKKDSDMMYVICHYSPAGNIQTLPVYVFGTGCTKLKPNADYEALCGEITPMVIVEIPSVSSDPSVSTDSSDPSISTDPTVSRVRRIVIDELIIIFYINLLYYVKYIYSVSI